MSSFWLTFIINEALAAAEAFIASSGLKPAVKSALSKFIAAGTALLTAIRSASVKGELMTYVHRIPSSKTATLKETLAAIQAAFNPAQLSTWAEATHWASVLTNSEPFKAAGIAIKPQLKNNPNPTDDHHSGIYIPSWTFGPGAPIPHGDGTYWLHLFWSNGMQGMNAGLVREKFRSFPNSPLYVIGELLKEVQAGAK